MYGWTKYGGANNGLVKEGGDWYCQVCGKKQPREIPAFMFRHSIGDLRNFLRICAVCEHIYKKNKKKCTNVNKLISLCRKRDNWY